MTYETKTTSATPLNPTTRAPQRGERYRNTRSGYSAFPHQQLHLAFTPTNGKTHPRTGATSRNRFAQAKEQDTHSSNHHPTLLHKPHGRDPWLLDSNRLLTELGRIRQMILAVPLDLDTQFSWQSVLDATWRLESTLTWLIRHNPASHNLCSEPPE
jgi:hypothetical protein